MPATEPAAPSRAMVAALIGYELASLRIDAVKRRIVREGLVGGCMDAWIEAQRDLTFAVCEIDRARRAVPA